MYSYNKPRSSGRATIASKDTSIFRPQFGIQSTASTVNERSNKVQREFNSSKNAEFVNGNAIRRSVSTGCSSDDRSYASQKQTTSTHLHPNTNFTQRTAGHSLKRQVLPYTAFAQDLTNPSEPTSVSVDSIENVAARSQQTGRHSATSTHSQSSSVYLPDNQPIVSRHGRMQGDRVVFAESTTSPGVPIVYRTPDERSANPDRLNLDRRRLTVCPILEGEDHLRLLNYQHNLITVIDHLSSLRRLIFLDLYDNQIEVISGLGALKSLRVLMLGKNRIKRIENLDTLVKLDVLDLHGNQIRIIENLLHLTELRVLNLAGNSLTHVDNLAGMDALAELNLRRNSIHTVRDIDNLPGLQRLFLSFNEITSYDDIACLGESTSLSEVSLDGNPLTHEPQYRQSMLTYMTQLRQLDMKRVSEDERRIATVMARKDEEKRRENFKLSTMKERRRLAINNAQKQWEVSQGALMTRTSRVVRGGKPELYANHVANVANSDEEGHSGRPQSAKSLVSDWSTSSSRLRPSSSNTSDISDKTGLTAPIGDQFLSEIDGDTLNIFGTGALDGLDKNWGIQAAGTVTCVTFRFVDFNEIVRVLHKVRVRFPNVNTMTFSATDICHLNQLNALAQVRHLDNLTIDPSGNPVTEYTLWRTYVLFRLAHFSLKNVNDIPVSAADIVNAEKFFGTLAHITTSQLPQSRLLTLIGEKKKQSQIEEKGKKATGEGVKLASGETVGRAGLVYSPPDIATTKTQEQNSRKAFVTNYISSLTKDAISLDQKQAALQKTWPVILTDLVRNAVVDMWDLSAYTKRLMEELESGS